MQPEPITCKNCGNRFSGKYCNNCGEKVYTDQDRTIRHLFHEGFHFLTHFEGTFFNTLKAVFARPGLLSLDYCNGIRKKYFRPVSLFLFTVICYLLLTAVTHAFQGLNMNFRTYISSEFNYHSVVYPAVEAKMQSTGLGLDALSEKYNQRSPGFSKVLLLLYIPLIGLAFYALFFTRRRYFFDHLILATEFLSFVVLTVFIGLQLFLILIAALYPAVRDKLGDNSPFMFFVMGIILLWVIVACKRFYGQRWLWTILKSMVFFGAYFFIISYIYNLILFFTVFLFIK